MERRGMSKTLLVSFILGIAYAFYLLAYFSGIVGASTGGAIATAIVLPHMICVIIAVICNGIGCFKNRRGWALTGAIFYTIALVLFFPYFMFVILQIILSFIGFSSLMD